MRVIRFPGAAEAEHAGRAAGEELDAILAGEVAGPEAAQLRALREDVRALPGPLEDEFERELQARVAQWALQARAGRSPRFRARLAALRGTRGRLIALGGAGAAVTAALVAITLAGGGPRLHSATVAAGESSASSGARTSEAATPSKGPEATAKHSDKAPPEQSANLPSASSASGSAAPARLQQLAASVTLAAHGGEGVQEAADAVDRLAADDGGYVESSHVQARRSGGPSEAQLVLSIPSAKLSDAIAALGRIAPLRAVSQESQDITSSYDAAKRQLGDDEAVRRALLRALAGASTEGQIDSLRERLASNREALSRDRAQLHSISHTASTSQLEVAITSAGTAAAGEGTLERGLHDAGHVLAVAAAVALVALAVIVPVALLALVLDLVLRGWQRRRRESALDG